MVQTPILLVQCKFVNLFCFMQMDSLDAECVQEMAYHYKRDMDEVARSVLEVGLWKKNSYTHNVIHSV